MKAMSQKILKGQETKSTILNVAKKLFGKKGFAETSVEGIISELQITKGALYHHFTNKRQIFFEVCRMINESASRKWENMSWNAFKKSIPNLWDLADDSDFVQIWIRDSYSVLTKEEMISLEEHYVKKPIQDFLERMVKEKYIENLPSFEEAYIMVGMINQGLWLLTSVDKKNKAKTKQNLTKIILNYLHLREIKKF
ncbi:TetR/AcrR family transcriptional regulator [Leptospira jelokensis]|uniref:TetR/AcrR family transcriptional regulator n=1 Tax=Leptospira jelokensis TaxID=2484931 RepID=UPI0010915FBC|nr:TetR/AcrR family transcriptional regulator [Leptospira jelokensis]TGM05446.1 TetR/AcrR family transcriptional regulator [Leptospira jelokensis]